MMKKMRNMAVVLVGAIATSMLAFAGCTNLVKYERYADANEYTIGSATFAADLIEKVEIDWVNGSIEVEQTSATTVQIVEENGPEKQEECMRYYLNGNVLKVRYCQSGLLGYIDAQKKNLRVEIPAGLSLEIDSTGAMVTLGVLEASKLSIETTSGAVTAERIVADEVSIECTTARISVGEIAARTASFECTSGDIDVTKLSVDALEVETTTGDASFGVEKALSAEVESTSGDITFTLNNGLGAVVRLETIMGKLKTDKQYGKVGSRYDIYGTDGVSTECTIDLDVVTGDVHIK